MKLLLELILAAEHLVQRGVADEPRSRGTSLLAACARVASGVDEERVNWSGEVG